MNLKIVCVVSDIKKVREKKVRINRDEIVIPVDKVERNWPIDGDNHLIVLEINFNMINESIKKVHYSYFFLT